MVMMLLIMELWVGPTLAAANHCLALLHIFRAPPAQLVLRDPPCSILILKATATHLFLLIATPSPVLGYFYSHAMPPISVLLFIKISPLKLDILIRSINWQSSSSL